MSRRVLITGGYGFVGSNLVRLWSGEHPDDSMLIIDHLGVTSDQRNLVGLEGKFAHSPVDLRDREGLTKVVELYRPEAVINCATSYHYEEFPAMSRDFYETDVIGTLNLLGACLGVWSNNNKQRRFLHVSNDEVFGTLGDDDEPFNETCPATPLTAYASAKAAADHMVLAHGTAHNMDTVVTHAGKSFGPNQRFEHLIPFVIRAAFEGKSIHVPDASSVRDWIFIEDHCWGIMQCFEMGRSGSRYCLSGNAERTNAEVAQMTCAIFDRLMRNMSGVDTSRPEAETLLNLSDQISPDRRAMSSETVMAEFGWEPDFPFEVALENTVNWYLQRFLGEKAFPFH